MDDFGIKYTDKKDIEELLSIMSKWYRTKTDWKGSSFGGITLEWNYQGERWVELSLPEYIKKVLHQFSHQTPARPQDSPHPAPVAKFSRATPKPPTPADAPRLDKTGVRKIQRINGCCLWYMWACNSTTCKALNAIGHKQANATTQTNHWALWLLDYLATHPDGNVCTVHDK